MTRQRGFPLFLGLIMGVMMLWMVHRQIIAGDAPDLTALIAFIGAHVAIIGVALLVPLIAAPGLRRWLARLHRPDARHVALMMTGAAIGTGALHLALHGVTH